MAIDEVKRLEGWMTFTEAGEVLGYTKQGFHRLVFESPNSPFNVEDDVRGVGERPTMLIRSAVVYAEKERRDLAAAQKKAAAEKAATGE